MIGHKSEDIVLQWGQSTIGSTVLEVDSIYQARVVYATLSAGTVQHLSQILEHS